MVENKKVVKDHIISDGDWCWAVPILAYQAHRDGDGNEIKSQYATKSELTSETNARIQAVSDEATARQDADNLKLDIPQFVFEGSEEGNECYIAKGTDDFVPPEGVIPIANIGNLTVTGSLNYSKMVTTDTPQTITGLKTFTSNTIFNTNILPKGFIINQSGDSRNYPSENKVFQIEVDGTDGYSHYVAFNNSTDGSKGINQVMYREEYDVAYFNQYLSGDGGKAIYTNYPIPLAWKEDLELTDGSNNLIHSIGDEAIYGIKYFSQFFRKVMSVDPQTSHGNDFQNIFQVMSNDAQSVFGYMYVKVLADNQTQLVVGLRNRDGTAKEIALLTSD